jgi:hypothetical protein
MSVRRRARRYDQAKAAPLAIALFLALVVTALLTVGHTLIDPVLTRVTQTRPTNRVGDVVLAMPDGVFCRHLSFDNKTAEVLESGVDHCPYAAAGESGRSANVNGFSWGAQAQ